MQKLAKNLILGGPALLTGMLVLTPQLASAQAPTTTPGRYSDRDRSVDWNKQKEVLQTKFKAGRIQGLLSHRAREVGMADHSGE